MIIKEHNEELIRRFVEQLESYGIEIGVKLDQMEKEKQNYQFFEEIRKKIKESKETFCTSYLIMTEEEQALFQKRLLDLFKDQEIVDNILQEIVNLYYLKESGLIDQDEIAPQKEIAYENLETLATKIEKYLDEMNIDQLTSDAEKLSTALDRVVDLGSIMEGEENTPVKDIDFLEEVLESSNLTKEERKQLLTEIIQYNLETYRRNLERKASKEEPIEEIQDLPDDLSISPECMKHLYDLLAKREIIERIVRIVNDDYEMMINISSPTAEEQDQISSSIELAKEDMIQSIQEDKTLTPEEALEQFFKKYDETKQNKKALVGIIFGTAEQSQYPIEKQKEIIEEGLEFLKEKKGLISTLPRQDKERINQYTRELYRRKNNRKMVYVSKAYTSKEEVEKEAAYEIQILKELLDVVEEGTEDYAKISKRMEDILECMKEATKEQQEEQLPDGNIFFLTENEDTSFLEEDLRLDRTKGSSSAYVKEIINQLNAIYSRGDRILVAAQPVNPSYKSIKKQGVRYTTGTRTKVFFIPVGKKDSIIVGAGLIDGKDILKTQDTRVKRYMDQIEELKQRLQDNDTYREELKKSRQIQTRLEELCNQKELDDMFEETVEETIKQTQM